jgi:hypothetical protein
VGAASILRDRKEEKAPIKGVVVQDWIEEEFRGAHFGDDRLDRRCRIVADQLSRRPCASIPVATGSWKDTLGAYRFFRNARVNEEGVLKPHGESTLERIREHKVVLFVQDTTEVDLSRPHERMAGIGPLNEKDRLGLFAHLLLAQTPERVPLGVVDANIWSRDGDQFEGNEAKTKQAREKEKKAKPIEDKESVRWLQGYRKACEVQAMSPGTKVVCISDSEGDIYECFAEGIREEGVEKADWLIRACQDRSVEGKSQPGNIYPKLWEEVGSTKVLGLLEIQVSKNEPESKDKRKRRQGRSARTTTAQIYAKRVKLKAPYRKGVKLPNVEVNVVLVREIEPPADESAVEWLLLTSLPIDSLEQIHTVIDYYCCRWSIEVYFRILKSGCRIEQIQLETADRYKPCLALYMIIAWRVMFVTMLGRQCPEMPCNVVFSDDEWMSVYVVAHHEQPPQQIPSLQEMVHIIASFGGYLGRKHDGPPGPTAIWIGMQRMVDFALAWQTFHSLRQAPPQAVTCV